MATSSPAVANIVPGTFQKLTETYFKGGVLLTQSICFILLTTTELEEDAEPGAAFLAVKEKLEAKDWGNYSVKLFMVNCSNEPDVCNKFRMNPANQGRAVVVAVGRGGVEGSMRTMFNHAFRTKEALLEFARNFLPCCREDPVLERSDPNGNGHSIFGGNHSNQGGPTGPSNGRENPFLAGISSYSNSNQGHGIGHSIFGGNRGGGGNLAPNSKPMTIVGPNDRESLGQAGNLNPQGHGNGSNGRGSRGVGGNLAPNPNQADPNDRSNRLENPRLRSVWANSGDKEPSDSNSNQGAAAGRSDIGGNPVRGNYSNPNSTDEHPFSRNADLMAAMKALAKGNSNTERKIRKDISDLVEAEVKEKGYPQEGQSAADYFKAALIKAGRTIYDRRGTLTGYLVSALEKVDLNEKNQYRTVKPLLGMIVRVYGGKPE